MSDLRDYLSGKIKLEEMMPGLGTDINTSSPMAAQMQTAWNEIMTKLEVLWGEVLDTAEVCYTKSEQTLDNARNVGPHEARAAIPMFNELIANLKDFSNDSDLGKDIQIHLSRMEGLTRELEFVVEEYLPEVPRPPRNLKTFQQSQAAELKPNKAEKKAKKVTEAEISDEFFQSCSNELQTEIDEVKKTKHKLVKVSSCKHCGFDVRRVGQMHNCRKCGQCRNVHTGLISKQGDTKIMSIDGYTYRAERFLDGEIAHIPMKGRGVINYHTPMDEGQDSTSNITAMYDMAMSNLSEDAGSLDSEESIMMVGEAVRAALTRWTDIDDCHMVYENVSPGSMPDFKIMVEWTSEGRPSDQIGTSVFSCRGLEGTDQEIAESIYNSLDIKYDASPSRILGETSITAMLDRAMDRAIRGESVGPEDWGRILSGYRTPLALQEGGLLPSAISILLEDDETNQYYFWWHRPHGAHTGPTLANDIPREDLKGPTDKAQVGTAQGKNDIKEAKEYSDDGARAEKFSLAVHKDFGGYTLTPQDRSPGEYDYMSVAKHGKLGICAADKTLYLTHLWIDKEHQGSGHGSKAVDSVVKHAKTHGYSHVKVHTNVNPSFWKHNAKKHGGFLKEAKEYSDGGVKSTVDLSKTTDVPKDIKEYALIEYWRSPGIKIDVRKGTISCYIQEETLSLLEMTDTEISALLVNASTRVESVVHRRLLEEPVIQIDRKNLISIDEIKKTNVKIHAQQRSQYYEILPDQKLHMMAKRRGLVTGHHANSNRYDTLHKLLKHDLKLGLIHSFTESGELEKGTAHEMEHTDDPAEAEKIAKDHLEKDPEYYSKLAKCGIDEFTPSKSIGTSPQPAAVKPAISMSHDTPTIGGHSPSQVPQSKVKMGSTRPDFSPPSIGKPPKLPDHNAPEPPRPTPKTEGADNEMAYPKF